MSISALREKALAHNANQKFRYNVCLDEGLRTKIDEASTRLVECHKARDSLLEEENGNPGESMPLRKTISSPQSSATISIDKEIADLESQIEELEASIPDDSLLIIVFQRMTPTAYQQVEIDQLKEDGSIDWAAVWEIRNAASYQQCEDRHGNVVDLSWDQVRENVLSSADMDFISQGVTALNRRCSYVPFKHPNFGRRATS